MAMPARQPGARPPAGGRIDSTSSLVQAINQEMIEFEFHISPAPSSSRPQTGVGTRGTSSSSSRACWTSSLRRCGLSTASATSGMTGYQVKEVAYMLDVPLGTMLARLHRARKLFERELWTYAEQHGLLKEGARR